MIKLPKYSEIANSTAQVATKSAMNPILWKAGIAFPVATICSLFAPSPLNYIIFAVGAIPIIVGSISFKKFADTDPQRLQSETHIENMEIIEKMGRIYDGEIIDVISTSSSPNQSRLEDK